MSESWCYVEETNDGWIKLNIDEASKRDISAVVEGFFRMLKENGLVVYLVTWVNVTRI